MEINYLREFLVLAETNNFMEAADILYTSQSALSKHLKNLEKELGVELFDRTTRKVCLSKYGELFLPYAKNIVDLQNQGKAIIQSNLETDLEILTLGSIPALAQYNITDIFVKFKKSRPNSTLNVVQAKSEELKDMLRQQKCELAFIRFLDGVVDEEEDIVSIPYAVDSLVAVLPVHHKLANKKSIPLTALADEHFLLVANGSMLYHLAIIACKKSGFEPIVDYSDHRLENLVELVINGLGVALLMKPLAQYLSNPEITIVDVTPNIFTHLNLCYMKDNELSDAAKHFVECTQYQKSINSDVKPYLLETKQMFQD